MSKNYEVLFQPPPTRTSNSLLELSKQSPQYPVPMPEKKFFENPQKLTNEMREQLFKGIPKMMHGVLENAITNGLGGALGFPGSGGIGTPNNPFSEQLSDTTTLFRNLRWFFVSNYRQLLSELYCEIALIKKIVCLPVDDALRGGVEIKSKQLDEDEIGELQISLDRDDDLNTIGWAEKWARLFGGGGTLILTDQDPEAPLELSLIDKDSALGFRAVDMWELFWDYQNTDGYDPQTQTEHFEFYDYYAIRLHKTRVMRVKGLEAPSFLRPRLRGWGFSVVEDLVRSINQYLKATDLGFQVLDEFKLDVFKFKNLVNTLLSPGGEQQVQQRVKTAQWFKNYNNALILDSEDEFDHKQLSFAGLSEAMEGIRMQVAADMGIPIVKLFGSQSSKLGGKDDESELEVYNCMVESQVRNKIKYDILRVLELKCQKLFGRIPDDLSITFKPLRVLNAVDEETVKTSKFTRALSAKQAGELTTLEFRDICNRAELFPVRLDTNQDDLNPEDPDIAALTKGDDVTRGKDETDPGADREDSRTAKATEPTASYINEDSKSLKERILKALFGFEGHLEGLKFK